MRIARCESPCQCLPLLVEWQTARQQRIFSSTANDFRARSNASGSRRASQKATHSSLPLALGAQRIEQSEIVSHTEFSPQKFFKRAALLRMLTKKFRPASTSNGIFAAKT